MEIKSRSSQTSCLLVMLKLSGHQTIPRPKPGAKQGSSLRFTCLLLWSPHARLPPQCSQTSARGLLFDKCLSLHTTALPRGLREPDQKPDPLSFHSLWQTWMGETSCSVCNIPVMVCSLNCHHLHLGIVKSPICHEFQTCKTKH